MDDHRRPPPGDTLDDAQSATRSQAGRSLINAQSLEDLPLVLTIAEVSALLGCDRRSVYRLIRARAFPAAKVGSRWVIERDGVIAWLRADRSRSNRR